MKRVLVVSPRPPRTDGQGDQRRAREIVDALGSEWDVDVVSWLPDVDHVSRSRPWGDLGQLIKAGAGAAVLPAQVAFVQSFAPRSLQEKLNSSDAVIFVTNRAVPRRFPEASLVDFIDDLGALALRRAEAEAGPLAWFWRLEGYRVKELDRRLARTAKLSVAHSPSDAASIAPSVRIVPISVGTRPMPDNGTKVAFIGNLFYAPNHEAAMWMCDELAPALAHRGVPPSALVIAGRRPHPSLREAAIRSRVELRADVPDLHEILAEAAVALAPMKLGTGSLYKILDAVGAARPCIISPVANRGLGLEDGQSAIVRERDATLFADAVVALLADREQRARLARGAQARLAPYMPDAVAAAWRALVHELMES